jgi:hypothetical protein
MSPARPLVLALSLLAGASFALAVAPVVFRNAPTHSSRIGVALTALRAPGPPPTLAVLGSSVAMAGVDGAQLER